MGATASAGAGIGSSVASFLSNAFESVKSMTSSANMQNRGLFSTEDNVREAISTGITDRIKTFTSNDLNNQLSSSIDTKTQQRVSNIVAEVSRALDYERSASEAAESSQSKQYEFMSGRGEVSSNTMDYRDELRGGVSTLGVSRAGIETTLERERYGSQSQGTQVVPSMDAISDYLIGTQANYFETMIDVLESIDNKLDRAPGNSTVVGKDGVGLPPSARPGVKNIARDVTRGRWDFSYGDSSPGAVTTSGRGGSA
jgi:hypothetical protein